MIVSRQVDGQCAGNTIGIAGLNNASAPSDTTPPHVLVLKSRNAVLLMSASGLGRVKTLWEEPSSRTLRLLASTRLTSPISSTSTRRRYASIFAKS
jgi:hypothetical protein